MTLVEICKNGDLEALKKFKSGNKNGYLDILKYFYNKPTTPLNKSDALIAACGNNHLEVVKYLVNEFGLNANDVRSRNNQALRWACKNGYLEVVRYLKEEFGLTLYDVRTENNA